LLLQEACRQAAATGAPVWFEPVSAPKSTRATALLSLLSFISPNEQELAAMAAAVRHWQFDICRPAGEGRPTGQAAAAAPSMGQFAPMQHQQQHQQPTTAPAAPAISSAAQPLAQPASPAAATIDEVLQRLQRQGSSSSGSAPQPGAGGAGSARLA
jgi:hypothetical protein